MGLRLTRQVFNEPLTAATPSSGHTDRLGEKTKQAWRSDNARDKEHKSCVTCQNKALILRHSVRAVGTKETAVANDSADIRPRLIVLRREERREG